MLHVEYCFCKNINIFIVTWRICHFHGVNQLERHTSMTITKPCIMNQCLPVSLLLLCVTKISSYIPVPGTGRKWLTDNQDNSWEVRSHHYEAILSNRGRIYRGELRSFRIFARNWWHFVLYDCTWRHSQLLLRCCTLRREMLKPRGSSREWKLEPKSDFWLTLCFLKLTLYFWR